MNKTQARVGMVVIAAAAAIVATILIGQQRAQSNLREENQALRQRAERAEQVIADSQLASNSAPRALAESATGPALSGEPSREVLRLRGEVGRLRQAQESDAARKTNAPSPLSSLTENPEMLKVIRTQQKAGMTMIYKNFVKQANLSADQAEKLHELQADHVMDNIGRITSVLREGQSREAMDQVFKEQEAALQDKVQALLGPEAFGQYQDYSRNLASYLTAEQFKGMLSGDKPEQEKLSKQLYQAMQEETQAALAQAGLGPDFQIVPTLNFRNFASEEEAARNLDLLDSIYEKVTARAASFLAPDDLKKFGEFRTNAINGNRMGLAMNRKLMAPGAK